MCLNVPEIIIGFAFDLSTSLISVPSYIVEDCYLNFCILLCILCSFYPKCLYISHTAVDTCVEVDFYEKHYNKVNAGGRNLTSYTL